MSTFSDKFKLARVASPEFIFFRKTYCIATRHFVPHGAYKFFGKNKFRIRDAQPLTLASTHRLSLASSGPGGVSMALLFDRPMPVPYLANKVSFSKKLVGAMRREARRGGTLNFSGKLTLLARYRLEIGDQK